MAKPTFSLPVIMDARTTKRLLDDEVNRYGGLIWDGTIVAASDPTLAQQVRDDVAQSAADAQQSADDAALYDGPRFDTVTDFFSSTATFTAGTYVRTDAEGFAYRAVDTATATTVANAGGQAFEALPRSGFVSDIQLGAARDGITDDFALLNSVISGGGSLLLTGKCGVSAPLQLNDGQKIIGVLEATCGLTATTVDAQYGLREGLITIIGDGCKVENLSLDGNLTSTGNDPTDFGARSSGIYLRSTSSNALIRNVDAENMTRHGICVLGTGHRLYNISGGNCVADVVGFGSGEEATNATSDIRMKIFTSRGSQGRGAFEINDGCRDIQIDGVRATGQYQRGGPVIGISDHARAGENNSYIKISNVHVDRTSDYTDENSSLFAFEAGVGMTHSQILVENVSCIGGCAIFYTTLREVNNVKFTNVTAYNILAGVLKTGSVASRNLTLVDCNLYINFTTWAGATTRFCITLADLVGFKVLGGNIRNSLNTAIKLGANCDEILIDGLEIINPNRAALTERQAIDITSAPSDRGIAKIVNTTIVAPSTSIDSCIRIVKAWTNSIVKDNVLMDYSVSAIDNIGSVTNNQILTPNVEVAA